MAMTTGKAKFVAAMRKGLKQGKAAIEAGCSVASADRSASRWMKDPDVIAALSKPLKTNIVEPEPQPIEVEVKTSNIVEEDTVFEEVKQTKPEPIRAKPKVDSLAYLQSVYADVGEEVKIRMDAAKAALPYEHGKIGETGKKETKKDSAKELSKGGSVSTLASRMRAS